MEGGWPDDSVGRASDGGALCGGHASLHVQPRTESKVDVRTFPQLVRSARLHACIGEVMEVVDGSRLLSMCSK